MGITIRGIDKEYYIVVPCTTRKGADIMALSIKLTKEERQLAESYAKIHAVSVEEAFKKALFEKIEDEYDIAVANQSYNEYIKSGKKSTPIDELWKELEL